MIDYISSKTTQRLKKYDTNNEYDAAEIEWQLGIYLNYVFTIIFTMIFGTIVDRLLESIIVMTLFVLIRMFSGGVHMKSLTACALVSAGLFAVIPLITTNQSMVTTFNILNIIIYAFYAPNSFEDRNPSKLDEYKKSICIIVVGSNFLFNNELIALSFAAQAFLIMPFWKGGATQNEKADRS